ncbi:MAG: hypothetical protein H6680_09935 [Desulfobacteraceae bacterium]|nr:hypothetical protein [Desulfobacteraceae bacterium]
MKKKVFAVVLFFAAVLFAAQSFAHTPLCSCYDAGDGQIICEGGFSDGSSASGVEMRVEDKNGKTHVNGKMDEFSEFTFKKPGFDYVVVFNAGPGHEIKIDGKKINE